MLLLNNNVLVFVVCFSVSLQSVFGELKAVFTEGSVTFTQTNSGVKITIDSELRLGQNYKLTIHNFPVRFTGPFNEICKNENIGEIFGPQNVGDLTGRFKDLLSNKKQVDSLLKVTGQQSIFGRSLVIHDDNDEIVSCATIWSNSSPTKSVVGVFRVMSPGIAGTIALHQASNHPDSDTVVDIDLMLVDAQSESKEGLALTIHRVNETQNKNDKNSCAHHETVFNPHGVTACDKRNHKTCPVGDVYGKNGPFKVILPGEGSPRTVFIDSNLPLSGDNSVVGLYFVISENGRPLICTKIQEYQVFVGEVTLKYNKGFARFTQKSVYQPVMVNMSSNGLKVHVSSDFDSPCTSKNSSIYNVTEVGQAHGLTLFGSKSLLFRQALVSNGESKNMCLTIQPQKMSYHLKAVANFAGNNPCVGNITFEQAVFNTSKAYAFLACISVDLKDTNNMKTLNHDWHVHELPISGKTLAEQLKNVKGHYNPYKVYLPANNYSTTCNADFPFRCELGDLSSKLGTYSIGDGMKYYTETENYLASWHNILGKSVVVHRQDRDGRRLACADIHPDGDKYSKGEITVKNSSTTRDQDAFQDTVSKALSVAAWRVASVKFEKSKSRACLKYTFVLIESSTSDLHQTFTDIVNDNPGKLKDFAPACGPMPPKWKIDEGNVDEILGVFFGVLALVILIIAIVFWMRKKHVEEEQKSKLVVENKNRATNPGLSVESIATDSSCHKNPDVEMKPEEQHLALERTNSGKEYKVTTSL